MIMKKMMATVFAFALFAGVTATACDSCPAHAKKDAKKECATKCDKDKNEQLGHRVLPFSDTLYIEREDFAESPPPKFKRLSPGEMVRLRYAFIIRCDEVIKDDAGEIVELRCTYDPESGGGKTSDGRKVKGIIHWVSAAHGHPSEVTVYDHLFASLDPSEGEDFLAHLNPESRVVRNAILEPSLKEAAPGQVVQFERVGYFCNDAERAKDGEPSFHRTVGLRDTWAKVAKKG